MMINLSSFPKRTTTEKEHHGSPKAKRRLAIIRQIHTHAKAHYSKEKRESADRIDYSTLIYIIHAYAVRCARVRVGDKKANWGKFGVW